MSEAKELLGMLQLLVDDQPFSGVKKSGEFGLQRAKNWMMEQKIHEDDHTMDTFFDITCNLVCRVVLALAFAEMAIAAEGIKQDTYEYMENKFIQRVLSQLTRKNTIRDMLKLAEQYVREDCADAISTNTNK